MKKLLLLTLFAFLLNRTLVAQVQFAKSNSPYVDLIGATSVNDNMIWDEVADDLPWENGFKGLGFTFTMFGKTYDSIFIEDGYVIFFDPDGVDGIVEIGTYADLMDLGYKSGVSQSPISYKVEGTTPNRIVKVEWKNAGFFNQYSSLDTLHDYINIQVWIYEGQNKAEVRVGSTLITTPGSTLPTGFSISCNYIKLGNFKYNILGGDPDNPTNYDRDTFLNTVPSSGTVYTFTDSESTGIKPVASNYFSGKLLYPNPASDFFMVRGFGGTGASYTITDMTGKVIQEGFLHGNRVHTSTLAPGTYYFSVKTESGIYTDKFIRL